MSGTYEVPVPDEVKQAVAKLVADTAALLPPGWGLTTLCFAFGGGACMYFSTAEREGALRLMGEFVVHEMDRMRRPEATP